MSKGSREKRFSPKHLKPRLERIPTVRTIAKRDMFVGKLVVGESLEAIRNIQDSIADVIGEQAVVTPAAYPHVKILSIHGVGALLKDHKGLSVEEIRSAISENSESLNSHLSVVSKVFIAIGKTDRPIIGLKLGKTKPLRSEAEAILTCLGISEPDKYLPRGYVVTVTRHSSRESVQKAIRASAPSRPKRIELAGLKLD